MVNEIVIQRRKPIKVGRPTRSPIKPGARFGQLTVTAFAGVHATRGSAWRVKCSCGVRKVVLGANLRGGTRSCGCLVAKTNSRIHRKHGASHTDVYYIWQGLIRRCTDPKAATYRYYGGRGIRVCESWRHSFSSFLDHIGERPSASHSVDRKDVNGHYEPGNVRWATDSEQRENRRSNIMITAFGKTACAAAWARETGIPRGTIVARLRRGWSHERSVMPHG